jgi:DtxR family transcriptional regulator, Mn-dependent transcriptional regulator
MEKLSSSLEDYLEAVLFASEQNGAARPKDLATRLHVKAASVTGALKQLAEKGLINYAPYELVTLTDEGKVIANQIATKHKALLRFFTNVLGCDPKEVEEFACSMEHSIPDHILERFVEFATFIEKCPNSGGSWKEAAHGYFCKKPGSDEISCPQCAFNPTID